jgi:NitT/TauT family transport system substrate-binding protein
VRKNRLTVWIILLSLVLFADFSIAEDEIRLAYLNVVPSLPTFVALERGYFEELGLRVKATSFESGTSIVDALVAGRVDVNAMSSMIGYWLLEQRMPGIFKIFLVYGAKGTRDDTFVVMAAKDSSLNGIMDLKGKRIGVFPGITSLVLAKAALRRSFDPDKEVTFIELPPGNIVQALASGHIDAYFTPEPFGMMGVAKGVARYLVKSPMSSLGLKTGIIGGAFVFNSKFLEDKPLVAKKVKEAIYKGVDFIQANEVEARKYLVKYANLPEPFAMKIPLENWIKLEKFDKDSGQPYFDVLKKEGLFQKDIDTSQLYYQE